MSTTGLEDNNELFSSLLDDYFAECDDHLTTIRRAMIAVEASVGRSPIDRDLLEELFRSFHSIKGLSGMVGLHEAEQIAHELEHYLRDLRDEKTRLTPDGVEAIISNANLLGQVLAAHRSHSALPDPTLHLKRLTTVINNSATQVSSSNGNNGSANSSNGLNPGEAARLNAALNKGQKAWRFEFTPNAVRAEKGVNVNSVRSRLQEVGQLIRATPRVIPEGGVVFEFLVVTDKEEQSFKPWQEDGLIYSPYQTNGSAAATTEISESDDQQSSRIKTLIPTSNFVRVDLARLDDLMRMVGELVISRARLEEKLKPLETTAPPTEWRAVQETTLAINRQLRDLREGVMHVRMVPLAEVFERMQFVIRDLARDSGKKVKLTMKGQQTEIDKLLVERMMDPLLHLVRNAVSHGLETPDERVALGKTEEATIQLRASTAGEFVVIEIEDDGRGLHVAQIIGRARSLGLIHDSIDDADIDSDKLLDLICEPGFSTRDQADRASGRGVGMSVVKNTVHELGGTIELSTEAGKYTCFRIELPVTLAIAESLIVTVGDQTFAVPQSVVREVIEMDPDSVTALEKNEILSYRDGVLPLLRLSKLFGLKQRSVRANHIFVVGTGRNAVGIVVDKIIGQREIVVRAINDPLIKVAGIAGATELGDGRVVLILDAMALIKRATEVQEKPLKS